MLLFLFAIPAYGQDALPATQDIDSFSLEDLLNVQIDVASLFEESEFVVGSTVSSINPQKWKELGARRMQDALNNETSMTVYPTVSCAYSVSIRGYASNQTMVGVANLLDGIPVNSLSTGTSFYQSPTWELSTLNKIELIKGPGSAIYGTDAFHGVISLKTFESNTNTVSVQGSGAYPLYGDAGVNISQGFSDNLVRIDAAAGTSYQGDQELEYKTDTNETGLRKNKYDNENGVLKIKIKPSDKMEIKSGAYLGRFIGKDFPGTGEGTSAMTLGKNDLCDQDSLFYMGTLSGEYIMPDDISIKASGYYWEALLKTKLGQNEAGMYSKNNSETYRTGGDLIIKQPDNRFNLQWLAAYSFNREKIDYFKMKLLNPDGSTMLDMGDLDSSGMVRDINSTFCQLKWGAIKDRLFLLGGARYDDYSDFGTKFTPRGGIIILPTKKSSVKALYGRAFRAPIAMEKYGVGNLIIGDKDIEPETIDIYELIYILQTEKWKLSLNGYYSYWKNAIVGKQNPSRFTNEGENKAYGGEMRLFYSFNVFAFDLGFSYSESYAINAESTWEPGTTEDVRYDTFPKYSIIMGLYYTLKPADIKLFLNRRVYIGMKEAPEATMENPRKLPDYDRTDLNISKVISDKLDIYLDIRNITNRKNHVPSLLGNREGYVEPGISVMLRAGYKI